MDRPEAYLTVASILSGFAVTVLMFRIQHELDVRERHPEWPNWLAWADYLVLGAIVLSLVLVVLPIMAIREPSGWVLDVAAGSCAAAAIFLAAYPFAILDHYRIEIGAKRSGDRVKGEPLERVIVAAAFTLAAVTFGSIIRRSNMAWELPQTTLMLSTSLSALAAIFSGTCAFLSYTLARKIQDELKTDERIVAGVPIHPNLSMRAHSVAVIQCTLFNKSKRKTYLNSVSAYDRHDANIDVTWSDEIDQLGNPQNPCQLVGIVDSSSLFVRMNDGNEIDYARLEISHSFSKAPMTVIFDPLATWATN